MESSDALREFPWELKRLFICQGKSMRIIRFKVALIVGRLEASMGVFACVVSQTHLNIIRLVWPLLGKI